MSSAVDEVLAGARARADALVAADGVRLCELLHPEFSWTTHRGVALDRDAYVESNTSGRTQWLAQSLLDPVVTVVGDTAVLRCTVVDEVEREAGRQIFRMPMTQVWVHRDERWVCLAGHAGPLTEAEC